MELVTVAICCSRLCLKPVAEVVKTFDAQRKPKLLTSSAKKIRLLRQSLLLRITVGMRLVEGRALGPFCIKAILRTEGPAASVKGAN